MQLIIVNKTNEKKLLKQKLINIFIFTNSEFSIKTYLYLNYHDYKHHQQQNMAQSQRNAQLYIIYKEIRTAKYRVTNTCLNKYYGLMLVLQIILSVACQQVEESAYRMFFVNDNYNSAQRFYTNTAPFCYFKQNCLHWFGSGLVAVQKLFH